MNTNFGKLTDGNLTYAPNALELPDRVIINPSAEDYLANGYKAVTDSMPTDAPTGKHYEADGWEEAEATITRKWKLVDDPVAAKVYKVEDVIYNLIAKNALQGVKAVVGDYWELFTMRDVIEADNEIFAEVWPNLKAAIVESGAISEEDLDWVMADAEVK